ncbi:hypothetical protein BC835DRAFT_1259098, partial [Cytidiella melzeri]
YAEVFYFFKLDLPSGPRGFAMVSLYSQPHEALRSLSIEVVLSLTYRGDEGVAVVDASCIVSAIALAPHPLVTREQLQSLGY